MKLQKTNAACDQLACGELVGTAVLAHVRLRELTILHVSATRGQLMIGLTS